MTDQRLGKLAAWVTRNNLTVVKLDSTQKIGYEDVYPSFIAISWQGMDYDTPLRSPLHPLCSSPFPYRPYSIGPVDL